MAEVTLQQLRDVASELEAGRRGNGRFRGITSYAIHILPHGLLMVMSVERSRDEGGYLVAQRLFGWKEIDDMPQTMMGLAEAAAIFMHAELESQTRQEGE